MPLQQTAVDLLRRIKELLSNDNVCVGKEVLTVTSSSLPLASIPDTATYAIVQVESSNTTGIVARTWTSGAAPAIGVGVFRSHGDAFDILSAQSLKQFRVILETGGTTILNVEYFK